MGSEKVLVRIERSLRDLAKQQTEVCDRLSALEARVGRLGPDSETPPSRGGLAREELIAFLDQFRAGEALGEASTAAWAEVSDTECLRGGLRVVARREGMHAELLGQRIGELGGEPSFEIPEAGREQVIAQVRDPDKGDAEKVLEFVQRFPDCEAALKPIYDIADRLDDDPETQSLLRSIAQDERATLEFLQDACALLNPS